MKILEIADMDVAGRNRKIMATCKMKKMNFVKVIFFWGILIILSILSCSTNKKMVSFPSLENCLVLDPSNYNNADFNPRWLSKNGIKKIIQREYLDGRNGKTHLVTVLHVNSDGYLKTKYSGLSYPKDSSPNEKNIASKCDYTYEIQDSFLIQKSQIVRFYNEKGKMEKSDTLEVGRDILNLKSAFFFKNESNEIRREYKYDKDHRLIEVVDSKGKSMFKIDYQPKNIIQVEKYSHWNKEYKKSWATFNNKGQIVKNYDESNLATHEFLYNEAGEMIEEKSFFKDKEPNYFTYEYIK